MKKNLVFKLGLFCAALVLVATCFVTNAWAKYTTTVYATDTAQVAKWDVWATDGDTPFTSDVTPVQIDVFTTSMSNIYKDGSGKNTIDSKKLIAPGSKGGFTFTIGSKSQVAVRYQVTVTDPGTTIPLKWTVLVDGVEVAKDKATLIECFNDSMKDFTFDPTDGVTGLSKEITINWEWPYEVSAEQDKADTLLGETPTTYTLDFEVIATQVKPV